MNKLKAPTLSPVLGDAELWKLTEDYFVSLYLNGDEHLLKIPKGFKTDLASSPRWSWIYTPPVGKYVVAAIVHDWLCTKKSTKKSYQLVNMATGELYLHSRKDADNLFLQLMEELGVKKSKRMIMYYFVRLHSILRGKK